MDDSTDTTQTAKVTPRPGVTLWDILDSPYMPYLIPRKEDGEAILKNPLSTPMDLIMYYTYENQDMLSKKFRTPNYLICGGQFRMFELKPEYKRAAEL